MKKLLAIVVAVILTLTAMSALAEDNFKLFRVEDGYTAKLSDSAETESTMRITFEQDDDYISAFTINVDGMEFSREDEFVTGDVYAVRVGYNDYTIGTIFLVEDYGMDDYTVSYCYFADGEQFFDLGWIPGTPETISYNSDRTFDTTDRACLLGTWNYPKTYTLAAGYSYSDEDGYITTYGLAEVPQQLYTMGTICTLNIDLPLHATMSDDPCTGMIAGGQKVMFAATDMQKWVYVSTMDRTSAGWIKIDPSDYPTMVDVGGKWMEESDVFSDIMYAG